jgi:hypothetical protein
LGSTAERAEEEIYRGVRGARGGRDPRLNSSSARSAVELFLRALGG